MAVNFDHFLSFGLASERFLSQESPPGRIMPFSDPTEYRFPLSNLTPSQLPENVVPLRPERMSSRFPGSPMKSDLVEKASELVSDPLVLINLVSKRVRQLNSGRSPLVPVRPSMGVADIALTEIIEGKIRLLPASEQEA